MSALEQLLAWHREREGRTDRKVSRKRARPHVVWEKPSKARCVDEAKTDTVVQPAGDAGSVRGNSESRVVDSGGKSGGHQRANGDSTGNA